MRISSRRLRNSGRKCVSHLAHDQLPRLVGQDRLDQVLRAEVAGHDDHRLAKAGRAALPIGQAALFHHLEQDVQHPRMGLFHLVEQHDGVRPVAHGVGELPAALIADITRRRADQAVDGVLLLVFAHVQGDRGLFAAEQELGQRLGQLCLAHAGRPQEQERADWPARVLQADAGRLDRPADGQHRLLLADDPLVEVLDHAGVAAPFVGAEPGDRDAGHQAGRQRHVVGVEPGIGNGSRPESQVWLGAHPHQRAGAVQQLQGAGRQDGVLQVALGQGCRYRQRLVGDRQLIVGFQVRLVDLQDLGPSHPGPVRAP